MSAITILALQILAVASLPVHVPPPGVLEPPKQLRGGSALAAASAPSNSTTVPFLDADSCEDCVYKEAQCGCEAAVQLFACFTKHCHSSNHSKFAAKCAEVSTSCSTELDIACRGPDTQCKGKYNQLPSGGIGLTLDLDGLEDDAFCGPFGKCTGVVHMKASIFYPPPQTPVLAGMVAAPAPASSPASSPASAPAPAPAPSPANPVSLECGLPIVPNADVDNQTHWTLCRAQVIGDKAGCDLPMFPSLEAGEGKEAYCVLTEGTLGNPPKRLTQPTWHLISNTYEKVPKVPTPKTTDRGFFLSAACQVFPSFCSSYEKGEASAETQRARDGARGAAQRARGVEQQAEQRAKAGAQGTSQRARGAAQRGREIEQEAEQSVKDTWGARWGATKRAKASAQGTSQRARERAQRARESTRGSTQRARESVGGATSRARERAREGAQGASSRARGAAQGTSRRAREAAEGTSRRAREAAEAARKAKDRARQAPPYMQDGASGWQ